MIPGRSSIRGRGESLRQQHDHGRGRSGLGCAALEHVRTSAGSKGIGATVFARQADSSGFQMQFAAAAQKIDAAHLRVYLAADDMGEYAATGEEFDRLWRARIRRCGRTGGPIAARDQ